MNIVIIDGVEYVPKTTIVSQAALTALSKAYSLAFGNGVYDPCCKFGGKAMREIWDLLHTVNEELCFRR